MSTLYAAALVVLILAALIPQLGRHAPAASARLAAAATAAAALALAVVGLAAVLGHHSVVLSLGGWLGFGHSALRADGIAGIFLALTGLTGTAVALASLADPIAGWSASLAAALLLFVAVAIGADNGFLFVLAWEALSVCVYLTANSGANARAVLDGYLTGGLAKLGGASLLAAVGVLYAHTHSFELAVWSTHQLPAGTRGLLFALFMVAFATKIGLVPLQGALPAGYSAAPRLGAASLSVALNAGFYGVWRFCFAVLGPLPSWCGDTLLIVGTASALAGIGYALLQEDFRRFLGYSGIEHAGIVSVGFAVALLGGAAHNQTIVAAGLLAATLHVIAHNLAKTLALITADRLAQATGADGLAPLGGLARMLRPSACALAVASLTLAALPPFGGFVSEWFTLQALLQAFRLPQLFSQLLCALAAAGLVLTSGLGLLAFARFYGFIFLGPPRAARQLRRERWSSAAGPALLGLPLLALGALAPLQLQLIGRALAPGLGFDLAHTAISSPLVLGPVFAGFATLAPTWLYLVLAAYGLVAWTLGRVLSKRSRIRREPVWVSGNDVPLAAVQYRPGAYSNPIRVVLRGVLGFRSRLDDRGVAAPEPRYLQQRRAVLAIDRFVYRPLAQAALSLSALVRRTQSGRLSAYLLYMLVALIVVLILVPVLS